MWMEVHIYSIKAKSQAVIYQLNISQHKKA